MALRSVLNGSGLFKSEREYDDFDLYFILDIISDMAQMLVVCIMLVMALIPEAVYLSFVEQ